MIMITQGEDLQATPAEAVRFTPHSLKRQESN